MARAQLTNNAASTLLSAITAVQTTIQVQSAHGAKFPVSGYFYVTLSDGVNTEICKCTSRATDVFTVTRAQEGTVGFAFAAGDKVELRLTAAVIGELVAQGDAMPSPGAIGATTPSTGVFTTVSAAGGYFLKEKSRSVTASTATTNIDLQAGDFATFFNVSIQASTTITFTNLPATTNEVCSFTVKTTNNATAGYAIAWGNSVKWAGGIVPPRTTTANAVDVWNFFIDNGVVYGSLSEIDAK